MRTLLDLHNAHDYLLGWKFTCAASGTLNSIRVYASGSANIKAGIYADASGEQGALLASNAGTACTTGWNTLTVSPISVVVGTVYWLTLDSSDDRARYITSAGACRYLASAYANALPNPAGTGWGTASQIGCIAGYGSLPAAAPTVTSLATSTGPHSRRHLSSHHRYRIHRSYSGPLRRDRCTNLHRQQ